MNSDQTKIKANKSWEDLTQLEQARELHWDMYKDAYGVRPRDVDTSHWTLKQFEAELEELGMAIEAEEKVHVQAEQNAVFSFEKRNIIPLWHGTDSICSTGLANLATTDLLGGIYNTPDLKTANHSTHSTHSMRLRSHTLHPVCTLTPPSLNTQTKPIKPKSILCTSLLPTSLYSLKLYFRFDEPMCKITDRIRTTSALDYVKSLFVISHIDRRFSYTDLYTVECTLYFTPDTPWEFASTMVPASLATVELTYISDQPGVFSRIHKDIVTAFADMRLLTKTDGCGVRKTSITAMPVDACIQSMSRVEYHSYSITISY